MRDSEDDEDESYIPAVFNRNVRKASNATDEMSKVAWSRWNNLLQQTSCSSKRPKGIP